MSLRRFRWWAVLVPVLVARAAVGLGIPALGAALVVTDALQPSDAIFVLDGGTPVRELEAASLYRLGYAPRVVVARGRDAISVARQVSGEPSRQERAVRVLRHVGVPEAAVVTLSQEVDNTVQELAADFAFATKQGLRRVILVTSANHTRRVRVIWNSRYERRIRALVCRARGGGRGCRRSRDRRGGRIRRGGRRAAGHGEAEREPGGSDGNRVDQSSRLIGRQFGHR